MFFRYYLLRQYYVTKASHAMISYADAAAAIILPSRYAAAPCDVTFAMFMRMAYHNTLKIR